MMKTQKSRVLAVATLLATLALAGCGDDLNEPDPDATYPEKHYAFEQVLPDGDTVLCVWAGSLRSGGLSCDWEGLHAEQE